jgi:hypothetical protein
MAPGVGPKFKPQCHKKKKKKSREWYHMPVVSATKEVGAGR